MFYVFLLNKIIICIFLDQCELFHPLESRFVLSTYYSCHSTCRHCILTCRLKYSDNRVNLSYCPHGIEWFRALAWIFRIECVCQKCVDTNKIKTAARAYFRAYIHLRKKYQSLLSSEIIKYQVYLGPILLRLANRGK